MSFSQLPHNIHPFAESTAAALFCEQLLEMLYFVNSS